MQDQLEILAARPFIFLNARLRLIVAMAFGIGLLAFALYGSTLRSWYVSDDFVMLHFARNATLRDLWQKFVPPPSAIPRPGYYRPLGLLLWYLGYQAGGIDPLAQRLISLLLHSSNCALLFLIALRLGLSLRSAACSALLFACFPTHAEAVTWLSGRFDVAATFFALLAILVSLRLSFLASCAGALLFACSLATKEATIILPALMALVFSMRLSVSGQWSVRRLMHLIVLLAPFAVTGIAYLVFRYTRYGGLGGPLAADGRPVAFGMRREDLAIWMGELTALLVSPFNWRLLLQRNLSISMASWFSALAIAVLATLPMATYSGSSEHRPNRLELVRLCFFGAGWILISCIPLIGTGGWSTVSFEATRYLYLPSVGICLLFGTALFQIPIKRPGGAIRVLRGGRLALLLLTYTLACATVLESNQRWQLASEQARTIVDQIKAAYPNVPRQTTFGVPKLPDNYQGAFVFRNGIAEALRLAYFDETLHVMPLNQQLVTVLPRPDRLAELVYRDGQLVRDPNQQSLQRLTLQRTAAPSVTLPAFDRGFYPQELDQAHVWNWMRAQGCVSFILARPDQLNLAAELWSPGPERKVQVTLDDQLSTTRTVTQRFQSVALDGLQLGKGKHQVCFKADATASLLERSGGADRREVSIAVGDFRVEQSMNSAGPFVPQHPRPATFANGMNLVGFDLVRTSLPLAPEQYFGLTLYWRANVAPESNLMTFVHLVDASGKIVAQVDAPPAGWNTSAILWGNGEDRRVRFDLTMPSALSSGNYRLIVGLYDAATGERVPMIAGQANADSIVLSELYGTDQADLFIW